MNWLTHLAILIGLRRFEDAAKQWPDTPDDVLQIANSCDSYPVRGAAILILESLARAVLGVLHGNESIDQLLLHASCILGGLCLIWLRHSVSLHDVQINTGLAVARQKAGLPAVIKTLIVALGVALGTAPATTANAVTVTNTSESVTAPILSVVSGIFSNTEAYSGVGTTLGLKYGPSLAQQFNVIGFGSTNAWLHFGIEHDSLFATDKNHEQLGVGLSAHWDKAPKWLKIVMFNANDVTVQAGFDADTEVFTTGRTSRNRFGPHLSIGRSLP